MQARRRARCSLRAGVAGAGADARQHDSPPAPPDRMPSRSRLPTTRSSSRRRSTRKRASSRTSSARSDQRPLGRRPFTQEWPALVADAPALVHAGVRLTAARGFGFGDTLAELPLPGADGGAGTAGVLAAGEPRAADGTAWTTAAGTGRPASRSTCPSASSSATSTGTGTPASPGCREAKATGTADAHANADVAVPRRERDLPARPMLHLMLETC